MSRVHHILGALACALLGTPALGAQQPLTLQQAIELAQRRGHAARAATSARDAARWRDRAFGAQLLPQLSIAGQVPEVNRRITSVTQPDGTVLFLPNHQTRSELGLQLSQPLPFTGGQLFMQSNLTRVDRHGTEFSRSWQSSPFVIGVTQELFRPNRLAWDRREQTVRATVAERQFVEAREDVALGVTDAFFNLYSARMTLENAQSNVAVNDTLYTLSSGRFEVGKIGENDLLQSELALLRARTTLDGARLEHDRAVAQLRLLLNLDADAELTIVPPIELPAVRVDTALAVAEALRNRSQIAELELQGVQARRRVTEARLSNGFSATLRAQAGFNQTATVFEDAYRAPLEQQYYALSIQMPLVQWGARRAQIEAARADEERYTSTSRLARESAAQEARFAARQLLQSERQLAISAKADTVASKRFEVAKNRYVIGKIGIDNLYMAQSEKDQALNAYVQSLRGYWVAYYRLRRLTLYDFAAGERLR